MAIDIYQNKTKYLIATAAFISAAMLLCPYTQSDTPLENVRKIASYSISITTILVFLFNRWIWKWLPEFLSGRPNLSGTWKGKIEYRSINPDDKKDIKGAVDIVYVTIRQTFLSTKICVFTPESESHSLCSNITQTDTGSWELSYTYDNTPDRRVRDRSQRHRGAAELKINRVNGEYKILGDYWTDRWSQGHLNFLDHRSNLATNYASANQMFEGTI
jgi:hypothetical protein